MSPSSYCRLTLVVPRGNAQACFNLVIQSEPPVKEWDVRVQEGPISVFVPKRASNRAHLWQLVNGSRSLAMRTDLDLDGFFFCFAKHPFLSASFSLKLSLFPSRTEGEQTFKNKQPALPHFLWQCGLFVLIRFFYCQPLQTSIQSRLLEYCSSWSIVSSIALLLLPQAGKTVSNRLRETSR